jgi:hypothetical protein
LRCRKRFRGQLRQKYFFGFFVAIKGHAYFICWIYTESVAALQKPKSEEKIPRGRLKCSAVLLLET